MARKTALLLVAMLSVPPAASAAPVAIELGGSGVNCGKARCAKRSTFSLTGALTAEVGPDLSFSGITGDLSFKPLARRRAQNWEVVGGSLDFGGDLAGLGSLQLANGRTIDLREAHLDGDEFSLVGTMRQGRRRLVIELTGKLRGWPPDPVAPVPEPASGLLLAAGGILVGAAVRRRL